MGQLGKGGAVLFVEDDPIVAVTISAALRRGGYAVTVARSVAESVAALKLSTYDVAVLDMLLPDGRGTDVAATLRTETNTAVLMLTAFSEPELVENAIASGSMSYLVKPVTPAQLIVAVEAAMARGRELSELRQARLRMTEAYDRKQEVSTAVGIVMERLRLSRDQAFATLRAEARERGEKLVEVAARLIHAAEVLYGHDGGSAIASQARAPALGNRARHGIPES